MVEHTPGSAPHVPDPAPGTAAALPGSVEPGTVAARPGPTGPAPVAARRESTLKDVADLSGVSIKTASRVLNDDPRVAPATRELVASAMRRLDYRPDPAARSLRAGRDRSVGVVVDSIGDVFFAALVASVETVLSDAGYHVLIASSHRDPVRERAIVQDFLQRRCAGVIVTPSRPDSLAGLRTGDVPVVFADRVGDLPGSTSVVVEDLALARQATEHLIAHGHRRIALLGDIPVVATTQARHAGYRQAMVDAGIGVDERLVRTDCPDASEVLRVIEDLFALDEPPTALISANTRLSLGVVPALHLVGRTDTALLAFGDFAMAETLAPAVTVIDHDPQRVGRAAAEALLDRLRPRAASPAEDAASPAEEGTTPLEAADVVLVPAGLIARGSGELPPRPTPAVRTNRTTAPTATTATT